MSINVAWGGVNIEHIVVDDGSTDNTTKIIEQYSKQYEHIKFIPFPNNRGTNAARNAAIAKASGKWCIILDSDDYFVDDAINIVDKAIQNYPGFKHYAFTPNDMQGHYANNKIICGRNYCVLNFPDFLNGYVDCDFVHICKTSILKKYPFDESLRIWEGVFFLQIYREVGKVLFLNQVVTIRERRRYDSVSREYFRTNKGVIEKRLMAAKLKLMYFEYDLTALGMLKRLNQIKMDLLDNLLLLGRYEDAIDVYNQLKSSSTGKKCKCLRLILKFRLAVPYRIFIKSYSKLKNLLY